MPNHVHFLIEQKENDYISLLMKYVTGKYARYINSKYKRTGALYESRFRSGLVQCDAYFMNCLRYIDLNPVRSEIVKTPDQYPWSSYNFHTKATTLSILSHHPIYLSLGNGLDECRIKYSRFALEKSENEYFNKLIRERTNFNGVIGTDKYIEKVKLQTGLDRTCYPSGRPKKTGSDTVFYQQSYPLKTVSDPVF